jgi:hypothetical protein
LQTVKVATIQDYLDYCSRIGIKPCLGTSLQLFKSHWDLKYKEKWKAKLVVKQGKKALKYYPQCQKKKTNLEERLGSF